MRSLLYVVALSLLAACSPKSPDTTQAPAAPANGSGPATWNSTTVIYDCEGDQNLQVAYLNIASGAAFAVLYYNGELSVLRIAVSGSGARYVAVDEQNSFRWHTKGDSGVLSFLAADHTAQEEVLLRDCKATAHTP